MASKVVLLSAAALLLVVVVLGVELDPDDDIGDPAEDDDIDYDVKKLPKKIYGGKELSEPPKTLEVTEEIFFVMKIKNYTETGKDFVGKITIGCFGKETPVTCLNFISLAKGYKKGNKLLSYNSTKVQKIVRDFMIQMGEIKTKHGNGESIFGINFQDESFALSHSSAGWVGMANLGPDTNGSEFYILLRTARWLDGRHVLFGKVVEGMSVLQTIAKEQTGKKNRPLRPIYVSACGVVGLKKPYTLTDKQFNTDGDIDRDFN